MNAYKNCSVIKGCLNFFVALVVSDNGKVWRPTKIMFHHAYNLLVFVFYQILGPYFLHFSTPEGLDVVTVCVLDVLNYD